MTISLRIIFASTIAYDILSYFLPLPCIRTMNVIHRNLEKPYFYSIDAQKNSKNSSKCIYHGVSFASDGDNFASSSHDYNIKIITIVFNIIYHLTKQNRYF